MATPITKHDPDNFGQAITLLERAVKKRTASHGEADPIVVRKLEEIRLLKSKRDLKASQAELPPTPAPVPAP